MTRGNSRFIMCILILVVCLFCNSCSTKSGRIVKGTPQWPVLFFSGTNSGSSAFTTKLPTKELWRHKYGSVASGSPVSNPTVGTNTVYSVGQDGVLRALDEKTGKEDWHLDGPYQSSNTALCQDNTAVFVMAGIVQSVSLAGPQASWSNMTRQGALTTRPTLTSKEMLAGANDAFLYCFDKKDGNIKWKTALAGISDIDQPPCASGTKVFQIVSGSGQAAHVYSVDMNTGGIEWERKIPLPAFTSQVMFLGGKLFFGADTVIYAFNAVDGTTSWTRDAGPGTFIKSVMSNGSEILSAMNSDNRTWKVDSYKANDGSNGTLHLSGPGAIVTPLVGCRNLIVFGTSGNMIEISDRLTGRLIRTFGTGKSKPVDIALSNQSIIVTTDDGTLHCFSD